jgi:Big-like domain-containing protein
MRKSKTLLIILLAFFLHGCGTQQTSDSDADEKSVSTRALPLLTPGTLATEIIEKLGDNLLGAGYSNDQAAIMQVRAETAISNEKLENSTLITQVAPSVLVGAQLTLADSSLGVSSVAQKKTILSVIISSITGSLKDKVESNPVSRESDSSHSASTRREAPSSTSSSAGFEAILKNLISVSVQNLDEAGVTAEESISMVKIQVNSMAGCLLSAGVNVENLAAVTKAITIGAVGSLDEAGIVSVNLGEAVKSIIAGTVTGLRSGGLEKSVVGSVVDEIVEGSVIGLMDAGLAYIQLDGMISVIMEGVNPALEEAGFTMAEIASIQTEIENAATMAQNEVAAMIDQTNPTVSSVMPTEGASEVAINTSLIVQFTKAMNSSTITVNTFDTTCSGSVQLSVDSFTTCIKFNSAPETADSVSFTLSPADNLEYLGTYKIKIITDVKDVTDRQMETEFKYSRGFTTSEEPDTVGPVVSATTPMNATGSNTIDTSISITFDEAMDPATITANQLNTDCTGSIQLVTQADPNVCIRMNSSPVASNYNKTFTLITAQNLTYSAGYLVKVTNDAKDIAGNSLRETFTQADGFSASPFVSSTVPENATGNIKPDSTIVVNFTESMDISTVTANSADTSCSGSVQLIEATSDTCVRMTGSPVASDSDMTFTMTPASNLDYDKDYYLKITTDVQDLEGISIAAQYLTVNGFTTLVEVPQVSVIAVPVEKGVDLSWDAVIGSTFTIFYETGEEVTISSPSISGITENAYEHRGLTNDVTYDYKVLATRTDWNGPLSTQVAATPFQPIVIFGVAAKTNAKIAAFHDASCDAENISQGLNLGTVYPFISGLSITHIKDIPAPAGRYVQSPNGTKLQISYGELWDNSLLVKICSAGVVPCSGYWWSFSMPLGELAPKHCYSGTSESSSYTVQGGTGAGDNDSSYAWIYTGFSNCNYERHILCVGW